MMTALEDCQSEKTTLTRVWPMTPAPNRDLPATPNLSLFSLAVQMESQSLFFIDVTG